MYPNIAVYILGVVNVFIAAFVGFFQKTEKFYSKIGLSYFVYLIILLVFVRVLKWSNNLITLNLKDDLLDLKKLKKSIFIKLGISSILIFFVVFPFIELEYHFSEHIFEFLKNKITSIPKSTLKTLSEYVSGFFSFIFSTIIALIQGVLGSVIYDYFIKSVIENRKKKSQK